MIEANYDQNELNKFAALASHWWDVNGELKTLHDINPLRLGFIEEKVNLQGTSIIDVGCGGGILTESLAQQGALVTGIDMNQSVIDVAKLHLLESHLNIEYRAVSIEALAREKPHSFDVVTCLEMLEHVPHPKSIVESCAKLLKPNGHVFFSTLNRNAKAYLFAILGAEYILKLLPKNTHDYAKFIRPAELAHWCRQFGITPLDIKGIKYNPLTKKFSLSKDTSVNYLFYARKNNE